jgi:hypothetical protein
MVVDDNTFNLQTIELMIKNKFGIEPVSANDGNVAVDKFIQRC